MKLLLQATMVMFVVLALTACDSSRDRQVKELSERVSKLDQEIAQSKDAIARLEQREDVRKKDVEKQLGEIKDSVQRLEEQSVQPLQAIERLERKSDILKTDISHQIEDLKESIKKMQIVGPKSKEESGAPQKTTEPETKQ